MFTKIKGGMQAPPFIFAAIMLNYHQLQEPALHPPAADVPM
jgi:hypothetical protein